MGNDSNSWILPAVIVIAVLAAVFLVSLIGGTPRSDFNRPAELAQIEEAISGSELSVCAQGEFDWPSVPGFVSGKFYDISTNCSAYDANRPGARVLVVKFDSVEARDIAIRNFETGRRHIGSTMAWSIGPFAIFVDGNQRPDERSHLKEAIAKSAQK